MLDMTKRALSDATHAPAPTQPATPGPRIVDREALRAEVLRALKEGAIGMASIPEGKGRFVLPDGTVIERK